MDNSVSVREATLEDAEALRHYVSEIFAERLPTLFEHSVVPTIEDERVFIANCSDSENSVLLLAELDHKIVGVLDFHGYDHPQRCHSGALGMSVSPGYRGRGIGTELLKYLFDWASSHSITRIELEVLGNNHGAIRLYERLGFEHEGARRRAVVLGDGHLDLIQMAKLEKASG